MSRHFVKLFITIQLIILFPVFGSVNAEEGWKDWKYRMPVKLTYRSSLTSGLVPVDVTFSLFAERCKNPEKEIRLILKTGSTEKEIPFQLSGLSLWTKDTDGSKSLATLNGMITFFDDAPGNEDAEYLLLYGNPAASAPSYPTDLSVSGAGPAWTIENSKMIVKLHKSGQISAVTLKAKPDVPIAPDTGIMHWNPGIFIPTRYWAHSFAWDPPEIYELKKGPIFVEITRSGIFPRIPEVHLSITYRIFSCRAYVESGTVMRVLDDIGVVALRNDEFVFDAGFFSYIAWDKNGVTVIKRLENYKPVNRHGDILRISDTAPFITMFNPSSGVGAASVRISQANIGPNGGPPVLFDNATYISSGGHELQYWFRPLIYFHVDWDRKQLITVPEGSTYSERNLYLFFEAEPDGQVDEVVNLSRAVQSMPGIQIGEYRLPPEE